MEKDQKINSETQIEDSESIKAEKQDNNIQPETSEDQEQKKEITPEEKILNLEEVKSLLQKLPLFN